MATKLTWRRRLAERLDPGRGVRRGRGRPLRVAGVAGVAGVRAPGGGGRKVREGGVNSAGLSWMVQAPPTPEEDWRTNLLDDETLSRINARRLGELLVNLSPEASKALWDFLRLMNPGFTIRALNRSGRRPYGRGQAALDGFLQTLKGWYGPLDVVINRLMLMAWLRGAFLAELVLDAEGRTPIDIATPDPWVVRFRKVEDPARGEVWQLGQYQGGEWVTLDGPMVRYIPVDPLPGAPYGRSLAAPALFSCLFLLGMLHDLRRVVSQQGYPRLDLEVGLERLVASMPEDSQDDPEKVQEWVQAAVDQVSTVYASLQPDDAYVHTDVVKVNRPVGAVGSESLGAVDGLIRGIERMAIRALKTMPIFMASNEAVSETHARWQWEIQSAGIQALQHLAESLLGYLFELALRVQGIDAVVEVRFAQLNEMLRKEKAETEKVEIENAARKRDEGWISQDEAAVAVTGHEAVERAEGGGRRAEDGGRRAEDGGRRAEDGGRGRRMAGMGGWRGGGRKGTVNSQQSTVNSQRETGNGERLIGEEEELPEAPEEVVYSNEDIDRVSGLWDEVMGDLGVEGLLEAEVEEGSDQLAVGGAGGVKTLGRSFVPKGSVRGGGEETGWVWEARAKRYRNRATGRFIGQEELRELRDVFVERMTERTGRLTERLFNDEISVQRWTLEMRGLVKDAFAGQYMAARGGREAMTQSDWGRVGRMVRDQYGWLQGFAEDVKAGKLTVAQARARAGLYMAASTQAFERGKSESYGMPTLPAYPGDGGTECRTNCKCHWVIREFKERWEATWTMSVLAEHCDDCLVNATKWAPLVFRKEG